MSSLVKLFCDYSGPTLDGKFIMEWCAGPSYEGEGTTEEVRREARKNGWSFRKGKDYHTYHFKKRKA